MHATFKIQRQWSQTCRFAVVSVSIAASTAADVVVPDTVSMDRHWRREVELGVWHALRNLPDKAERVRVQVTELCATYVDTGVGDLYEAAARAVWQALGIAHEHRHAGFSEPELVRAWLRDRVGRPLLEVTEARHALHVPADHEEDELLHVWLRFEHCPAVRLHGVGDLLAVAIAEPYAPYDMGEHGRVSVGPARSTDLLATMVGSRLLDGAVITAAGAPEDSSGLLLRFENGDVVLGSLGDEWVISAVGSPAALPSLWRLGTLATNIDM